VGRGGGGWGGEAEGGLRMAEEGQSENVKVTSQNDR